MADEGAFVETVFIVMIFCECRKAYIAASGAALYVSAP
jgi:hypothetical protein